MQPISYVGAMIATLVRGPGGYGKSNGAALPQFRHTPAPVRSGNRLSTACRQVLAARTGGYGLAVLHRAIDPARGDSMPNRRVTAWRGLGKALAVGCLSARQRHWTLGVGMLLHCHNAARLTALGAAMLFASLSACGTAGGGASSGLFGGGAASAQPAVAADDPATSPAAQSRFRDLFGKSNNPNQTIKVNKYIWTAALDVLNFLPVESVDPFTGVIVTGYGKPPGGGRAYRATILVQDPALDARSLKLSMQTQGGGAVDPATIRAVEDAILTRARELRIADSRL